MGKADTRGKETTNKAEEKDKTNNKKSNVDFIKDNIKEENDKETRKKKIKEKTKDSRSTLESSENFKIKLGNQKVNETKSEHNKKLHEEKNQGALEEKNQRFTALNVAPSETKKKLEASPSEILQFNAKAKQLRGQCGSVKRSEAKCTFSLFDEKICKRLQLDDLPKTGKIYDPSILSVRPKATKNNEVKKNFFSSEERANRPLIEDIEKHLRLLNSQTIDSLKINNNDDSSLIEISVRNFRLHSDQSVCIDLNSKQKASKMIFGTGEQKHNARLLESQHSTVQPLQFRIKDKKDFRCLSSTNTCGASKYEVFNKTLQNDETKILDTAPPKGGLRYELSNKKFIEKGWTLLPTQKVLRKMNVYKMTPVLPEADWFMRNRAKSPILYDTGETLAKISSDGQGKLFYRNGSIALEYNIPSETNAKMRYVVYSSGFDEMKTQVPVNVLAHFDLLGNGVVYDQNGKVRLKYNQCEGTSYDKSAGPVTHWKWHTRNEPSMLQSVMLDNQLARKESRILQCANIRQNYSRINREDEEINAIEYDTYMEGQYKKLGGEFKPFQITMKAIRINKQFTLKVLDQTKVYLTFRDGINAVKFNLGLKLDAREIINTETALVGEVGEPYGALPTQTKSLCNIKEYIHSARRQSICTPHK